MNKVKYIKQTRSACPSQWEGELENGQDFYIRYRWGHLTLDVPFGTTIFGKQLGGSLSGYLSDYRMLDALSQHLDFSNVEWESDYDDWQQTQEDAYNSGRP